MDPSPVALGAIPIGAPGYEPRALAVDSATGLAFVGLYPTYLDVVSLSDEHVITTINLGANESPTQAAVDNQTGVVYVTTGSHYVIAVSEASSTIIARISVGQYPSGIAYDWENGYIYTANFRSSNLSVIDTTTNTVVHTFEVLPFPQAVTFDPVADRLIVMGVDGFNPWGWASSIDLSNYTAVWTWYPMLPQQQGSAGPFKATVDLRDGDVYATWVTSAGIPSVLVLSGANGSQLRDIPIAPSPSNFSEGIFGIVYETSGDMIYVSDPSANSIAGIAVSNNTLVRSIPVGAYPFDLAYDSADGMIYVTNMNSQSITKVNATSRHTSGEIFLTPGIVAIDYAPTVDRLFAVGSDRLFELSTENDSVVATVPTELQPQGVGFDPLTRTVLVTNSANGTLEAFAFPNLTRIAVISVCTTPIGVTYDNQSQLVYVACYGSNEIVAVQPANMTISTRAQVGVAPTAIVVDHSRSQLLVTNIGGDSVSVLTVSPLRQITEIPLPLFAAPAELTIAPGLGEAFVADRDIGEVSVISLANNTVIENVSIGENPFGIVFQASSNDVFVTDHAENVVWVMNASSSAIVGNVTVGWFPIAITIGAGTNSLFVANSASGNVSIIGLRSRYSVTFTESGLPADSKWSVSLNDTLQNGTSAQAIIFHEFNGTYPFAVLQPPGYFSMPTSGNLTVAGAAATMVIRFSTTPFAYRVSFVESGLPSGSTWSVTVNDSTGSTTHNEINFTLAVGTYSYEVGVPSGYAANPSNGTITVNQSNQTVPIGIASVQPSYGFLGLPGNLGYYIVGAVLVAGGILTVVALLRRGRSK